MTRKEERETAFTLVFQSLFRKGAEASEIYETYLESIEDEPEYSGVKDSEYIRRIFFGTLENADREYETIKKYAVGWNINRISRVALAILMTAVYELSCSQADMDAVVANEAVVLCKKFETEKTAKFVNGVISSVIIAKNAEKAAEDKSEKEDADGENG